MDGHDLKQALMRRHEITQQHPSTEAADAALSRICIWMGWDVDQAREQAADGAMADGTPPIMAALSYLRHGLRERLNAAKWQFVRQHSKDPVAVEIVELARAWQTRVERQSPDDDWPLEFPSDEEAYGEPERHPVLYV